MEKTTNYQIIGLTIYKTLIFIQRHQPNLLFEKWRTLPWQNNSHKLAFLKKINQAINAITNKDALLKRIDKILRKLFLPNFFESIEFQDLRSKLWNGIELSIDRMSFSTALVDQFGENTNKQFHKESGAIAMLLLDAENLQIEPLIEESLENICQYPLRFKLAFANWRQMGKRDSLFHERGYELFHVPEGKDMADGKMITIGSSLQEHYPMVREVLVCSSDKVMTSLCTKLSQQGLTVHHVFQKENIVYVINWITKKEHAYSIKSHIAVPSLDDCIVQIKELIKYEQERCCSSWVKLTKISQLFHVRTGCTIKQVVSTYRIGKQAKDLFLDKADFVVDQPSGQTDLYVRLANFRSRIDLERALVDIMKCKINDSGGSYIDSITLASHFNSKYRQPITQVLEQLQLPKKYEDFLRSCQALQVQKQDDRCKVTLRQQ